MIGQAGANELPGSVKLEVKWQLKTGAYLFFFLIGRLLSMSICNYSIIH